MQTNNHQIVDYSSILEKKYGKEGTAERAKFEKVRQGRDGRTCKI